MEDPHHHHHHHVDAAADADNVVSKFSFPLLPGAELLQSLEALGARPPDGALDRPTADALRPVYEVLVAGLTGVSR